jgi:hypothetical protein
MAPQKRSSSAPLPRAQQRSRTRTLTILGVGVALISALFYFLDSHLEWFYIFSPSQLHDISLRAISAHGNDTAGVVAFIAGELNEKFPGGYVNLEQEWIFNNAGGAMGAMYVIHASKFPSAFLTLSPASVSRPNHMTVLTVSQVSRSILSSSAPLLVLRATPAVTQRTTTSTS